MGNETQPDRATTADPQLGAREPREMNIDLSGAARIHVNVGDRSPRCCRSLLALKAPSRFPERWCEPAMRIGLDSYSYHRFFGEWYPGLQDDPGRRMTFDEFLERACALGVAGVSIESCFMHDLGSASIDRIRDRLDRYGFERVWAWGHLDGLSSGSDANAEADHGRKNHSERVYRLRSDGQPL